MTRLLSLSLLLAVLASPNFAKADAAGDLAAGQAALQELELEKALPLLKSAAEALPKSVEAQLTVAECQLRLGNLEQALTGYRAVVKLSPKHKLATRMVNALTGRESSFEKKMAMTRALITVEDYAAAAQSAAQAVRLPADAKQRRAAQLLQAECYLWNADLGGAVTQSLDIIQQGDAQASGIARVIAVLALVENPINNREVEGFIKQVGEVPQLWKTRLEFAQGLLLVHDLDQAAAASALLLKSHTSIPASAFRHNNTQRAAARLILHVGTLRQRGEISKAWNVMRPLAISAAAQAVADKKPGSIPDANTGWYVNPQSQVDNRWITAVTFGQLAGTEFRQNGTQDALRGYRIGAAVLDGYPEQNERITDSMQRFANELNSLSRVDADRVGGQPLSPADAVQFEILGRLANRAVTEKDRAAIVAQIDLQLKRYAAADDLKTGLNQFLTFDKGQNPSLTEPYNSFPIELTRQELLNRVAQGFAVLGAAATSKVEAAVIKRAVQLNEHDTIALKLYAKSNTQNSKSNKAHAEAMRIVSRYSSQANWDAAGNALALLYKGNSGSAGQWADVSLTLQQARHFENQLVAARRSIGTELSAPVQAALAKAAGIVKASPNTASKKVDRHTVTQIAADWINRYAGMGRLDLSEAFIAGLADGDAGAKSLADWALWNRVNLLHMQANKSLARTAAGIQDRATVAVDPKHVAELALLSKIIIDHSSSDYAPVAVSRVAELSVGYQAYRAYPAATSILTNFLKAHPNLSSVQQFEFGIVDLQLADANNDLNESVAKNPKVEKITAKHLTAINAIAAFLKKYPVGDYSRSAEDQLFAVLKRYGEVGAWNVSRDVLAEFTKALPDYRSPAHLKLLQAATFLGELNTKHGMAMLTPNPTLPKTSSITTLPEFLARDAGEAFADPGDSVKKPDDSKRQPPSVVSKFESVLPGQSVAGIFRQGNGQGQGQPPAGFGGGGGGFRSTVTTPSASSLAMIRQSKSLQFQQLAMLEGGAEADLDKQKDSGQMAITLPSGTILSIAEMTRQDTAADNAYKILIGLAKSDLLHDRLIAEQARGELMWMFGYFEGSLRYDRAIALLKRYLVDNKSDPDHIALAYRALEDRLAQVSQPPAGGQMDHAWVDARHTQFENTRTEIAAFIKDYADEEAWANSARLLKVNSYQTEANLVVAFSGERASGLLVQSASALLELQQAAPKHPDAAGFPTQLWNIAEQLAGRSHSESAISVLRQVAVKYPTHQLGTRSILRIAQLYGTNLSNPIMAVKTYQEYLNKTNGDAAVPTEIYNIANQLAQQQRFLEALHVYGIFVDSFPTDGRAAQALHAIGKTHQANAAWQEAINSYDRVFEDYPDTSVIPQARLDVAECQINLGEWSKARRLYENYLEKYPKHAQVRTATARLVVLKKLARFQDLLADDAIDRNKDDAQYQIGKTVLTELSNPLKAVAEFRKVVKNYPKSDVADDAQLEIGRTLLSLNQLDAGRIELLKIPKLYKGSPLADDALFLVAQSYEQFAARIASVTFEKAREESHRMEQNQAYVRFNKQIQVDNARESRRRGELKKSGKSRELALNDAAFAWQQGSSQVSNLFCHVTQAELQTETETALQIANRRDQINDAFREAVVMYAKAATDYPLGDMTDQSLLRVAVILESKLKDRPAAMQTYQKIVRLFPGTPVAEDAAWKVSTFHVQEGQFAAAADAYQNFIRNYPASTRVAEAQFGMAEVLEQLGRWNEAMDAYEVFRQKFNKHPKVALAQQQITWIKTYRK